MDDIYIEPDLGEDTYMVIDDRDESLAAAYKTGVPTYVKDIKVRVLEYIRLEPLLYRRGVRARIRIRRVE